ncbi:MAG: hypothetical protein IPI75_21180 [Gammaproteobacteria bacterium]|nr:hypothetical protein [Gammaproteobacteria bacterium]
MSRPNSISVVLHVGMPKCGSSALQLALSGSPELRDRDARALRYVALLGNGKLLQGSALRDRAANLSSGYVASVRVAHLGGFAGVRRRGVAGQLREAASGGARLLLSNEAWGHEHAEFRDTRILEQLGVDAEVVIYVRPQVAWCNSAWWQWGAWKDVPPQRWVRNQQQRVGWADVVKGWQQVPGVSKVHVRLLPPDIVADFCALLGAAAPLTAAVNPSLPETVLRVFQRHRWLRATPDDSAIEFAIGRHLHFEGAGTPWVLDADTCARIVHESHGSNLELLELLDDESRARMRDDPAWWSAQFYAGRGVQGWKPPPANAAQSDQLAAAALDALFRVDTQLLKAQARIRKLEAAPQTHPWIMSMRSLLAGMLESIAGGAGLFRPRAAARTEHAGEWLVLSPGLIPTTDIYLRTRLGEQARYIDTRATRAAACVLPDGACVIIVRHAPRSWLRWLEQHRARLARVVYLLDDDIPQAMRAGELPLYYAWRTAWRYALARRALERVCSEVWVSTDELRRRYPEAAARVCEPLYLPCANRAAPERIYFYHGSRAHRDEIAWLVPVVRELQAAQSDWLFEIFGDARVRRLFAGIPRVRVRPPMRWPEYLAHAAGAHYLVGLAPCFDTPFNRARSHAKLFDITRLGAAGVYSALPPYAGKIEPGATGVLCANKPGEWVEAVLALMRDETTRHAIHQRALAWCEHEARAKRELP